MTLSSSDNDFSEDIDLYKIILSDDFMSKFSKFDSIDDFFNSSNFDITTEEDLKNGKLVDIDERVKVWILERYDRNSKNCI